MSTITQEIVKARYDLRDEDSTQYTDAMLVDYYNRSIDALAVFLAKIKSDLVFADTTSTITSGDNYVALPNLFASPIAVEIDDTPLFKKETRQIKKWQQDSSSGTPEFYGIHKLNLVFERAVSEDTSVYIQYNEKATELALGDSMPYNNDLNNVIRSAVVMLGKNRNERDITGNYGLHSFYEQAGLTNIIRRSWESRINLGY